MNAKIRHIRKVVSFISLTLLTTNVQAENITECDRLAAHPSDPDRVAPGLDSEEIDTEKAIAACRLAVEQYPENPRLSYQLGRVLYYQARTTQSDRSEGLALVQQSADMGHTQALFVRGLLHGWDGEHCQAEPLMKAAAERGLKSARLSYVDAYLAGHYSSCAAGATTGEMLAYLEGAETQVEGYYENMLLDNLQRQLNP